MAAAAVAAEDVFSAVAGVIIITLVFVRGRLSEAKLEVNCPHPACVRGHSADVTVGASRLTSRGL